VYAKQEDIMKHNVGGFDLTVRIVVGIGLLLVGLVAPISAVWQIVALTVAAIALITAVVQFCPLNAILGINTCRTGDDKHHPA
jgi:hypothetical protein